MEQKLRKLIADVLEIPVDQVGESTTMENTDTWDSLKHMELVVGFEENFHIELGADEMMEMTSFNEIKRVLGTKGIQW